MRRLLIAAPLLFAAPALAQEAPEPKVNQLIIYGNDECPVSADDTITVCARKAEAERFRIPSKAEATSIAPAGTTSDRRGGLASGTCCRAG